MATTSVRLSEEVGRKIERLSKEKGVDRGNHIRKLKEYKIMKAMVSYREEMFHCGKRI